MGTGLFNLAWPSLPDDDAAILHLSIIDPTWKASFKNSNIFQQFIFLAAFFCFLGFGRILKIEAPLEENTTSDGPRAKCFVSHDINNL